MAFHTGTIAGEAVPATALMAALRPFIEAHADWELVEQINPGAAPASNNTAPCDVYRNIHKNFIVAMRGYNTTILYPQLGEAWDGTAKQILRATPPLAGGQAVRADGSYADLDWFNNSQGLWSLTSSATSFDWHLLVTRDCLIAWTQIGTAIYGGYWGEFETFMAADPGPYVIGRFDISTNTGSSLSVCTRHPGLENAAANNLNFKVYDMAATACRWGLTSGRVNAVLDAFHGAAVGARIAVYAGGSESTGKLRGRYRHMLHYAMNSGGVLPGDTITVNGRLWECAYATSIQALFVDTEAG